MRIVTHAAARECEHVLGEVDECEVRLGEGSAQHGGEKAGARAEFDDVHGVGGNELEGCGVEGFVAWDELHAVAVVGGGGGIEDCAAVVHGHRNEHKRS